MILNPLSQNLVGYEDPKLYSRSVNVDPSKHVFVALWDMMQGVLEDCQEADHPGFAVAAPQTGFNINAVFYDLKSHYPDGIADQESLFETEGTPQSPPQTPLPRTGLIQNLNIEQYIGDKETRTEGCLSFPHIFPARTLRYPSVEASGFIMGSKHERPQRFRGYYTGLFAHVLQHEFDHVQGRVFIERLDGPGSMTPPLDFDPNLIPEYTDEIDKIIKTIVKALTTGSFK